MDTLQGVSATSLLTLYVRAIDASTAQPVLGDKKAGAIWRQVKESIDSVSYTHLTLPTILRSCRSRWSPYH